MVVTQQPQSLACSSATITTVTPPDLTFLISGEGKKFYYAPMSDFASINDPQCELKCDMEAYVDPLLVQDDFSWCDTQSEGS